MFFLRILVKYVTKTDNLFKFVQNITTLPIKHMSWLYLFLLCQWVIPPTPLKFLTLVPHTVWYLISLLYPLLKPHIGMSFVIENIQFFLISHQRFMCLFKSPKFEIMLSYVLCISSLYKNLLPIHKFIFDTFYFCFLNLSSFVIKVNRLEQTLLYCYRNNSFYHFSRPTICLLFVLCFILSIAS